RAGYRPQKYLPLDCRWRLDENRCIALQKVQCTITERVICQFEICQFAIFKGDQGAIGILINVVILVAVLVLRWPAF
ncbi:MAG: hypothetical protein JXA33_22070, partial [Anaerolineae bacterium]|nr:hypothetical protein [Anaerolineae bacterium]